ncbi:MAG: pyrroline-5-carboxylate reductase [Firmicutes bacterium]|nr:pyrroline-5-carboxylate reductase [Bacillota bacterium]MDD4264669.1 pyrroline-5-carboxylate reductase [Bacillota bacterium]MDD4694757.1 pyrroline-5-carboxylate reductase [Bacillota bacterium]
MAKLGCIGYGAMGSALLKGFVNAGILSKDILVYDQSDIARKKAVEQGFTKTETINELNGCDIILLAVKPQHLTDVADIWHIDNKEVIVISILAGVTSQTIRKTLNVKKVIRVMPNLPAQIGKGVIAVNFSKGILDREREEVYELLSKSGEVYLLNEELFNAVTALSGSGPAFILLMLEALSLGAVVEGLDSKVALEIATNTMIGTAEYLRSQKMHPAALRDLVTSPQGTTAAGLVVLEEEGVRAALVKAIKAATERARQLQEGK